MHASPATTELTWFKSSFSGGSGSDCVEVAAHDGDLYVRDSKNPTGPVIGVSASSFAAFIGSVKAG